MRKIRVFTKVTALALAALMLLPSGAGAYSDTANHRAAAAIEKWSGEYGILQGYDDGTFRPDNTITRGAFAGILSRFLQYRKESDAAVFTDTAGEYWESAILKLNAAGVYLGTDGKALLTHEITRQQAVTMIARAFGIPESGDTLAYNDAAQVADYARGYLAEMTGRGYINDTGADGRFRPADAITRAEVVGILDSMIALLYQQSGDYTPVTSGTVMLSAGEGATLTNADIGGDLIVAPGVTGLVRLVNVTLGGEVRNLGEAEISYEFTDHTQDAAGGTTGAGAAGGTTGGTTGGSATTGEYVEYNGQKYPIYADVEKSFVTTDDLVWSDYERRRFSGTSDRFTIRQGIDVSTFQGDIDWEAVAGDGIDFAIVRCGGRGTSNGKMYTDARYVKNVDGAHAAGLETGVYFFAQAVSVAEAQEEADYVLALLEGHHVDGPVIYDWEILGADDRTYGMDPALVTACAQAFCSRMEDAGYRAGFYFTEYVGYTKYDLPALAAYDTWFANYSYKYPHFYYQVNYWQYSSSGTVAGIDGKKVDMDLQFIWE